MIKESTSIKTAFFLMQDWSRNLTLQNNWAAMYTLNFQLCLGSFDSEPPHCNILLFFKTFSNKRTIHHLSGEPGSNPHSRTAGVFWNTCTESLRKNSWAETQSSGGGRDQTTESSTGKATRICVCVLEDSRQICSGINMVCGYSLFAPLPRWFPGFGEQMIIGYTALE